MRKVTIVKEVAEQNAINWNIPADAVRTSRADGTKVIQFSGECWMAEPSDFESLDAVARLDERLKADFGLVLKGSAETGSVAGEAKGLVYLLNNGGLRLAYGDRVLDAYRPQGGGRNSTREAAEALAWAMQPENIHVLTENAGKPAAELQSNMIAAWKASAGK